MTDSNKQYMISLSVPCLNGNEKKYVNECLDTNWISSLGRFVPEFERNFAEYVGAGHAVALSSGTAALHLSLIASGIKADDEVFVPSLTFIASANSVRYVGAYPVFIDSDRENLGLSLRALENFIEENCEFSDGKLMNKKTSRIIRGLLPVHICGSLCRMDELTAFAGKYNLALIEDAAEAAGCFYKGKHAGTFAKLGCFSFNGNKTMTTGGGGMVVCDDEMLADRIRHLSTQAKSDNFFYSHDEIGYNYRMTNIQAAIGLAQLEHIDKMIERKCQIHSFYKKEFENMKEIALFCEEKDCRSNHWFALLFVPPEKRDKFFSHMESRQIQTRPLWKLNHLHPMFENCCSRGETSTSERLCSSTVCMPCHAGMSDSDSARVASATKEFFN